jgi:hypothetical protein
MAFAESHDRIIAVPRRLDPTATGNSAIEESVYVCQRKGMVCVKRGSKRAWGEDFVADAGAVGGKEL